MKWLEAWIYRQLAALCVLFKRNDMAIDYWQRIRALRPRDATVPATIAHFLAAQGRRAEAVALLHQATEIDPKLPAVWFNLGFLQQEVDDHVAAVANFDRALALDEKLDRAWYGKALSLIKMGRVEEAVPLLKRNTELQPMSPFGWYQLAHAYHRLGQSERAAKVIGKLSQFEPQVARQLERETGIRAEPGPTGQ